MNNKGVRNYPYAIFISRLPSETTDEDIKKSFISCGTILDISNKAKDKGYAFVYFESIEGVENAINLNGKAKIYNSVLNVEKRREHKKKIFWLWFKFQKKKWKPKKLIW